jgi:hypothetical protein
MIIAHAGFSPNPATNPDRERTEGLIDLPASGTPLYAGATDTSDPAAVFAFSWQVLHPRTGQTAAPADPTASQTTLENIAAVWGDVRLFLVAVNSTTGESSESDPRQAPESAFLTLHIESERRALTLPAIGSRAWAPAFDELTRTLEELDLEGQSISAASINAAGDLILTLTNGNALNAGRARGEDGADGADGLSVTAADITPTGHLELTLSDGSTLDAGELPTPSITSYQLYTAGPIYHYIDSGGAVASPLAPIKSSWVAGPWVAPRKVYLNEISLTLLDGGTAQQPLSFELIITDAASFSTAGTTPPSGTSIIFNAGSVSGEPISHTQALSALYVPAGGLIALSMQPPASSAVQGLSVTISGEE